MAIPTNFQGYTPAANTTKSFNIFGSGTVGIWANDVDGTLSATCSQIPLGPNIAIVMAQAYTNAQIVELVKDYLRRHGALHEEAAGGYVPSGSKLAAYTATTCT